MNPQMFLPIITIIRAWNSASGHLLCDEFRGYVTEYANTRYCIHFVSPFGPASKVKILTYKPAWFVGMLI